MEQALGSNLAASAIGKAGAESSQRCRQRITYISWAETCSRSDYTARELGGQSYMVYAPNFGSRPSTIVFKYVTQWLRTSRILRRERPDTVFVMTPPLFAALPAFWYAWRHRKRVVLDAHSGAFLDRRWRHLQWLQRILCRRAATTLVHNDHLAGVVRDAGGRATVVPDVPVVFSEVEPFPRTKAFTVAVICSFDRDEPVDVIVDAATRAPDVQFFVTGNAKHLRPELRERIPANMKLTGFISVPMYAGLLAGADVVMVLTTLDHTMLRGAYEAIYQGTPVIVSDWPILREGFSQGAIHVQNTAEAIVDAIRTAQQNPGTYREGARRLRAAKYRRWDSIRRDIEAAIALPAHDAK